MFQQLVYIVAFLGCVLLLVTGAMSLRLFATRASRPSGMATLSDTPQVRKMLLTLVVAVGVCAVAAAVGIILAVVRLA